MPTLGFFNFAGTSDVPFLDSYSNHPRSQAGFTAADRTGCINCARLALSCDVLPIQGDKNKCEALRHGTYTTLTTDHSCKLKTDSLGIEYDDLPSACKDICAPFSNPGFGEGYERPFKHTPVLGN